MLLLKIEQPHASERIEEMSGFDIPNMLGMSDSDSRMCVCLHFAVTQIAVVVWLESGGDTHLYTFHIIQLAGSCRWPRISISGFSRSPDLLGNNGRVHASIPIVENLVSVFNLLRIHRLQRFSRFMTVFFKQYAKPIMLFAIKATTWFYALMRSFIEKLN